MDKFFSMKKKVLLWVAVIGLFFAISACEFVSLFTSAYKPTPPPPDWITNWLRDPVCQPPCWYGITPGTTTITDTAKMLSELPWIKIDFGPAKPLDMGPYSELWWSTKQTKNVGGVAYSDDQGKVTASLDIRGTLSTKLEDVVEAFGFPSDVVVHDCRNSSCYTQLIYLSSGMMVIVYPAPDWSGYVKISPDTQVEEIWFFPPMQEGYLNAFPQYSEGFSKFAVPWDGYSKYKVAIW